jgi:CelD/BcsL family acetyltransferase involved in cellulose biosynthesis
VTGTRGNDPARTAPATLETWSGDDAFERTGDALDDLHVATGAPLTARRVWLRAWSRSYPSSEPWVVVVRDPASGRIDAAAMLSRRQLRDGVDVSPLGFGRNDRSRLPARTPEAAEALADRIAASLDRLDAPWTLRIEQLPADCPVAAALVERLDFATVLRGGDVPRVQFDPEAEPELRSYISKAMRKVLRKSENRIEADGHPMDIAFERSPAGVHGLIDEVERVHRERDHAVGRSSDLDSDYGVRFWRSVILDHADRGEVEIATLRLGGALAAYVVSFLDAGSYRVFDGRFATEWSRYSPGRLVETATLERAIREERFQLLDWMNSVAPDKLICANAVEQTQHMVACSSDRLLDVTRSADSVIELSDAEERPTADAALRALAGVGRENPRRDDRQLVPEQSSR